MKAEVITCGRRDLENYFELSGIFECEKLNHTPFLVFVIEDTLVCVKTVDNALALLDYPDETQVMGQWPGKKRSDFFRFTVGQYRKFITTGAVDA